MIKVSDTFINTEVPSADYPNGAYKNDDVAGDKTGTPINATTFNDWQGFSDALLAEAGIEPSGDADTALASDRLDAIKAIMNDPSFFDAVDAYLGDKYAAL